jgi:hypothetical protein
MISRFSIALPAVMLGAALLAPTSSAQIHGMRGPRGAPRRGSSFGLTGSEGTARPSNRRFLDNSAFLFYPYFYPDSDYEDEKNIPEPAPAPVQVLVGTPAPSPAPAVHTVEPLLLENRDGKWVRIPTGNQLPTTPQSVQPATAQASKPRPGAPELAEAVAPLPKLPPAVIVFRDQHVEELGKYMILGDTLFTNADYWTTGAWSRKIPLKELDIPASLKLNKERGTKFSLPASPNEVVLRF